MPEAPPAISCCLPSDTAANHQLPHWHTNLLCSQRSHRCDCSRKFPCEIETTMLKRLEKQSGYAYGWRTLAGDARARATTAAITRSAAAAPLPVLRRPSDDFGKRATSIRGREGKRALMWRGL